jgi:hypothetical protein
MIRPHSQHGQLTIARAANIFGFFGGKKKHQVFSPAAADET